MQRDVRVGRVGRVAVRVPVAGPDVDLDVAPAKLAADLEPCAAEVGAGPAVPAAGVEDADRAPARRDETRRAQPGVRPDALQVALVPGEAGRRRLASGVRGSQARGERHAGGGPRHG